MKIYVDESGQTGSVNLSKKSVKLNFLEQPLFVNGAVVVKNIDDEKILLSKYIDFKNRNSELLDERGEIKGSLLNTQSCNAALNDLIENVFDDEHFYINVYDKRFYLSTLLISQLHDPGQPRDSLICNEQADFLKKQDDLFFSEYCKFINCPSKEEQSYLKFLKSYKYFDEPEHNFVKEIIELDEKNNFHTFHKETLLGPGSYAKNKKVSNLINLNSLGELINFIKKETNADNDSTRIIHDNIDGVEKIIKDEIKNFNINITFENSEESPLLQLADNISSIFAHIMKTSMASFKEGNVFEAKHEWNYLILSKLFNKISLNHIKLTVGINDLAVYKGLADIFNDGYEYLTEFEKQFLLNVFIDFYIVFEKIRLSEMGYSTYESELELFKR